MSIDITDILRRLENVVRWGTVSAIDYGKPACMVDTGRITTDWLPFFQVRAGETTEWNPPTIGEQCLILSPSGDLANGMVLFGIHTDQNQPPSHSPDTHVRQYPDGAVISYNHATGALSATGIKTALIDASETITAKAGVKVTLDAPLVECTDKLTVHGLLTYLSGLSGSAGSGGGGTSIEGPISHTGDFSNEGSLSSNGITLATHTHSGVTPGGANTGGPA